MAADTNVRFLFGTLAKYQALETKDPRALYFVTNEETGDTYLYKGDKLYASDVTASADADGKLSKEDKAIIDSIPSTYATKADVEALQESFFWETL